MLFRPALVAVAVIVCPTFAWAAQYRILYQGSETLALQSSGPGQMSGYVAPAAPGNLADNCPTCVTGPSTKGAGTPNQIVTFLHPYTNKAITVPLTLPVGRPTIITRSDRIIYSYGLFSYRVVVKFLPNGQVEVRYRG